jgi:hypothetical protein
MEAHGCQCFKPVSSDIYVYAGRDERTERLFVYFLHFIPIFLFIFFLNIFFYSFTFLFLLFYLLPDFLFFRHLFILILNFSLPSFSFFFRFYLLHFPSIPLSSLLLQSPTFSSFLPLLPFLSFFISSPS